MRCSETISQTGVISEVEQHERNLSHYPSLSYEGLFVCPLK